MTAPAFLETLVSLSLQAALTIAAAGLLVRWARSERQADRVWAAVWFFIVFQLGCAFLLPHLRLLPHRFFRDLAAPDRMLPVETVLGRGVLAVWLAGVLIGWLRLAVSSLRTARIVRRARPIADEVLAAWRQPNGPFPDAPTTLDLPRGVRLLQSAEARSPFCWHFHRPAIVLPTAALKLPPECLAAIVRHEAAHLCIGHPLQLFVQRIVEALLWFHPLVWWASRQTLMQREFACDAAVACDRQTAVAYLKSLLIVVEWQAAATAAWGQTLGFGQPTSLMQLRAARLANHVPDERQPARRTGWPLAALAVCCLLAMAVYVPVDVGASDRSLWSPWPRWSAATLQLVGPHRPRL